MYDILTIKMSKVCSKCFEEKEINCFISADRCICKTCKNAINREKRKLIVIDPNKIKVCNICNLSKPEPEFIKNTPRCKDCNNKKRQEKYKTDEEHAEKIKKLGREYKNKKTKRKQEIREKEKEHLENRIGKENTICKYCNEVKPKTRFRHNRRKCADCERDDPYSKFTRNIRSYIYTSLIGKIKNKLHTIEYLGCSYNEYIEWLKYINPDYTLDNHGEVWHIDHVIPLSKFDLMNESENIIAWNWRNTMPLFKTENLQKNNKILKTQIEQHYKILQKYHILNNIEFPQEFITLFAKHLDAGSSLEPLLPLTSGNLCEELV